MHWLKAECFQLVKRKSVFSVSFTDVELITCVYYEEKPHAGLPKKILTSAKNYINYQLKYTFLHIYNLSCSYVVRLIVWINLSGFN